MKFLTIAVSVLFLASIAHAENSQPPDRAALLKHYYQVPEPIAPHIHVLRQASDNFVGVTGNVTVIEQEDGLVLVDSGRTYGSGKRVVELVRAVSPKPVKTVVITHWHNDHPGGLSAIIEAWPHANIIAQEATAAAMREGRTGLPPAPSQKYESEEIAGLREYYEKFRSDPAAHAKTKSEKESWKRALAPLSLRIADTRGTYLVLPKQVFTDRLTLPDPYAPAEIMFMGRANTSGDAVVWLPKQRVLVAGDAVVAPIPYMYNVYPREMLAVFDKMRATHFHILIPGHGRPMRDQRYLDKLSNLVKEVERQVGPLAKAGVPLLEIAKRTDFDVVRRNFTGGDPWLMYWFREYALNPLIESVYSEAAGAALGPPPMDHQ